MPSQGAQIRVLLLAIVCGCGSAILEPGTTSTRAEIMSVHALVDNGFVTLVKRVDAHSRSFLSVERLDATGAAVWSEPIRSTPIQTDTGLLHANAQEPVATVGTDGHVFYAYGHTVTALAPDGSPRWSRNFREWSASEIQSLSVGGDTLAICGNDVVSTVEANSGRGGFVQTLADHETVVGCVVDSAETLWLARGPKWNSGKPRAVSIERRDREGRLHRASSAGC